MPPEPSTTDTVRDAAPPPPALAAGAVVDRYVVLGTVGRGGMGVVYKAYDPVLDRRIALKVLSVSEPAAAKDPYGRERLLREAQVLAQLSHPNVVAIHDVGTVAGDVFLATEYVEGETLRQWLRAQRRPWRAVLDVFLAAGEGLVAAHRAGIVHRDFKPENVMVGSDGRVRVLDFGLARASVQGGGDGRDSDRASASDEDLFPSWDEGAGMGLDRGEATRDRNAPLTLAGQVVGTLEYLPPERFLGLEATERSDQYSFCVALYEALYGERPFRGSSRRHLKRAVLAGRVVPEAKAAGVPRWLRRVVLRGLAPNPERRHASLEELLEALRRDPSLVRRRRRVAAAGALLALAGVAGLGVTLARGERPCRAGEAKVTAVWSAEARVAMSNAFAATGLPYARDTFARTERAVAEYAAGWEAMHREACEATLVRHEQSTELLDLRMACLTRRLGALKAQVEVFGRADRAVVDRAVAAANALPRLDACADGQRLREGNDAPTEPERASRVNLVRDALARASALHESGQTDAARSAAEGARALLPDLRYAPLEAELLLLLARLQRAGGDPKAAVRTLHDAARAATVGRRDDLLVRAWSELAYEVGDGRGRPDDGREWARYAHASLARLGESDDLGAELLSVEGHLSFREGAYAEALALTQKALALGERALGPNHLSIARYANDVGNAATHLGRYDEAQTSFERTLRIAEAHLGPEHPRIAMVLNNLGTVADKTGRSAEALAHYERATRLWESAFGAGHMNLGYAHANAADALRHLGRMDAALASAERGLAVWEGALGPHHPLVAEALETRGRVHLDAGRAEAAQADAERALAILGEAYGDARGRALGALTLAGRSQLARGASPAAVALLDRAVHLAEATGASPEDGGLARAALAQALAATADGQARATSLARRALADLEAQPGAEAQRPVPWLRAWLARQGAP